MTTLEMLTRENKKLEREIEQLEFSNAILSRLFYYAAKKDRIGRGPLLRRGQAPLRRLFT